MAERILSDPNTRNEQKQKLLNCIHVQGDAILTGRRWKVLRGLNIVVIHRDCPSEIR